MLTKIIFRDNTEADLDTAAQLIASGKDGSDLRGIWRDEDGKEWKTCPFWRTRRGSREMQFTSSSGSLLGTGKFENPVWELK